MVSGDSGEFRVFRVFQEVSMGYMKRPRVSRGLRDVLVRSQDDSEGLRFISQGVSRTFHGISEGLSGAFGGSRRCPSGAAPSIPLNSLLNHLILI